MSIKKTTVARRIISNLADDDIKRFQIKNKFQQNKQRY
jgi:hypothetical protein